MPSAIPAAGRGRLRVGCAPAEPPGGESEQDDVLLRAVVQVARDPPPLAVLGLEQPPPRRVELGLAGLQIG